MLYVFGSCALDLDVHELRVGGAVRTVEPQVFDLLVYLVENRHRMVSKDEILEAIWAGRIVSDANLSNRIGLARQAIGDSGSRQALIKTFPRRGFRFVGEVEVRDATNAPDAPDPPPAPPRPTVRTDKPSLAVLPFDNLSGDPEQEYFSDGISEDIITALSRIRQFLVIARNTTFTYKGQAVDVAAVARDLGVRYVLSGSVRKAGGLVRISTQLVDGETGHQIWAERYDRELDDIFAVQDEITAMVVSALDPELSAAEQVRARQKPPENLDAWDIYHRAMWHLTTNTQADIGAAIQMFENAIERDPGFSSAYSGIAYAHTRSVILGLADDIRSAGEAALAAAGRAIALDDGDATAHWVAGMAYHFARGDLDAALDELNKAIELNPNSAAAHINLCMVEASRGDLDAAIRESDIAMRLSPKGPFAWRALQARALAHFFKGEFAEAERWSVRATRRPNASFWCHALCAASRAHLGQNDAAKSALEDLLRVQPDCTVSLLTDRAPLSPDRLEMFADGLRKIGLAE